VDLQLEEQEKELSAGEAAGVHHSTVLKAQERALQERQLETETSRAQMAADVSAVHRSSMRAPGSSSKFLKHPPVNVLASSL